MRLTAYWPGKSVAHLPSKGSGLGKFEMIGVTRGALTDETELCCNEDQVGIVARSDRLAHLDTGR
jgi:hypothetical protein